MSVPIHITILHGIAIVLNTYPRFGTNSLLLSTDLKPTVCQIIETPQLNVQTCENHVVYSSVHIFIHTIFLDIINLNARTHYLSRGEGLVMCARSRLPSCVRRFDASTSMRNHLVFTLTQIWGVTQMQANLTWKKCSGFDEWATTLLFRMRATHPCHTCAPTVPYIRVIVNARSQCDVDKELKTPKWSRPLLFGHWRICLERLLQAFARDDSYLIRCITHPRIPLNCYSHTKPSLQTQFKKSKLQLYIRFTASRSLAVRQDWYPMYYPGGMKARVSPVQSIEPHRILAPIRVLNQGPLGPQSRVVITRSW